jgi:monoamine oxidase
MTVTSTKIKDCTPLFDVIIVGGGLSGLMVARYLNSSNLNRNNHEDKRQEIRWRLFEGSSRIGGRLQNDADGDGRSMNIDLGAAWIWPRQQPAIMRALVNHPTLGIRTFLQPGQGYGSSTRIVGGAVEFVNKIYDELTNNKAQIQTEKPVTAMRRNSDRTITVELESGESVRTLHAILAVPPRILSKTISFYPDLPDAKSAAMSSSETWMAGVTKVALVYKRSPAFWPLVVSEGDHLLSPRKRRPAFQCYDGSPFSSLSSSTNNNSDDEGECTEKISVLTFFTLASLSNKNRDDGVLANECAEQMCDSLSADAIRKVPILDKYIRSYDEFYVKRWPLEQYISHDTDPTGITPHPEPIPELAQSEWDGMLLFAGTETDQNSPGVMEGAIGAAIRVTKELSEKLPSLLLE